MLPTYHSSPLAIRSRRGFTLIEIMVSISIIALIATAALISLYGLRRAHMLEDARVDTVRVLENARNHSASGVGNGPHGVHVETNRLTNFEGAAYSGSINHVETFFPSTITLSPDDTNIIFTRLSATTSAVSTIAATASFGGTATVCVTPEGGIISPPISPPCP